MRKRVCCLALSLMSGLMSGLIAAGPAWAQSGMREVAAHQLRYERVPDAGGVRIDAGWIEPEGAQRALSFHVPRPALEDQARAISPPSAARQQAAGLAAAEEQARHLPPGVSLRIIPQPGGMQVAANAPGGVDLEAPLDRVSRAYKAGVDRAILDSGYVKHGEALIEPDYRGLLLRQRALLLGAGQEIGRALAGLTPRERVALLLGFLQSVPYSTLHARDASALRTPSGVLVEDRGDCDEKSVTMATLLSITDPALSSVLLFDDAHAFMGVSLPPQPGDVAVKVDGRSYVLLEPVGPGWFPVGRLSAMSLAILRKPDVRALVVWQNG